MEKNPDPGWQIILFESLEIVFMVKILVFFDADPDPGSGIFWPWIRDGKIRIRDKYPGSATLPVICTDIPYWIIMSQNEY